MTFFLGSKGDKFSGKKQIAQGGQGKIILVSSDETGERLAVKWYHKRQATDSQLDQIKRLVAHKKPTVNHSSIDYIWPIDIVSYGENKSFGYLMPYFDSKNYSHYNLIIGRKVPQPDVDVLCKLSYLVTIALESVHRSGYAYCDVNLGNVQFDVKNQKIVICDNDNIVVDNSEANVLGVPDFMAPEVAMNKSAPNSDSDLYSIAILLYQMWMWEHPMQGASTEKVRCFDLVAKKKRYAEEPVFAHDPNNDINSIKNVREFALSLKRWEMLCTKDIKSLFTNCFTSGIHSVSERPRLSDWSRAFMEAESNKIVCKKCSAVNLYDHKSNVNKCFNCSNDLNVSQYFLICGQGNSSRVAVNKDCVLRRHHIANCPAGESALEIVGRIETHPKNDQAHIIRNMTKYSWYYKADGQYLKIDPGKARAVITGSVIDIDGSEVQVYSV